MTRIEVPVLIVGAGPVGLMGALLLARQGLEARLIDRRETPIRAPAAHVVNARTFEICRAVGVDMDSFAEFASDPKDSGQVRWVTNLAGEEIGRLPFERQTDEVLRLTPTPLRNVAQHRFEAVLRDTLPKVGAAEVQYGQQWESSEQDDEGVTSRVRDLATDEVYEIRSRYVISCDGAGSRVRKSLGIEMVGPQSLQNFVMIHFEANLRELVKERPAVLYWLTDPKSPGTLVAHNIDREWVYMISFDPDTETEADYSAERCEALVKAAIGSDEYPVRIETISTWAMSAQIADRYRDGRIILAGDAAHRFPPTGGLGLNGGVQDIHDLVWRLAAVEAGWAQTGLLDSYETERRPVAQKNADNSLRNAMQLIQVVQALGLDRENTTERMRATLDDPEGRARVEAAIANQADHFDTIGLQLGFRYDAGAIVSDGTQPPEGVDPVRDFLPSGRPGGRMPHAWLMRDGKRFSTLDLLELDSFTLITTLQNDAWAAAAAEVTDVPLQYVALDPVQLSEEARWLEESGIGSEGALLVRPDQHVAWRADSLPKDTSSVLREVIAQIVEGRTSLNGEKMSKPRLTLGHATLAARDLDRLSAFYCDVLGFEITNRGPAGPDSELLFLSQDPGSHHQIAMTSGVAPPNSAFVMVDHFAFRTETLDDLRSIHANLIAGGVEGILQICHGNAWSLYFSDCEGNGLECYVDTPFHVAQPFASGFDLDLSDEEILKTTIELIESEPEFKPMTEWQEDFAKRLESR